MNPSDPQPADLDLQLEADQRDRARDRGHFNQYGLRIDSRPPEGDRANPGTGDHARRFGAGGDPASYSNRGGEQEPLPNLERSSDAPASKAAP